MFKRIVFTTVTPLPSYIPRDLVIKTLHAHSEMIELNPLVIRHKRCKAPPNAPPDEFHCTWYELTDNIHYLPGRIIRSNVTYKACFHDLQRGLQTHIYAPTNLDIRNRWTVCGNMPGEPREPVELGLTNVPREGLFLREDVDMRCNTFAASFVKKTLKDAHAVLVDRLIMKADLLKGKIDRLYSTLGADEQRSRSFCTNQAWSAADGSLVSPTCMPLCSNAVSAQPTRRISAIHSPRTHFTSPIYTPCHATSTVDSPPHGYVDAAAASASVSCPTTPHPCCTHSPVSPVMMGCCFPFEEAAPGPQPVELDSTECQPSRAKAYATAKKNLSTNFVVTPPSPPPNVHELE
ncbi:hypothetical protein I7I48_00469 [Histoplasma ohiense]|nr:hypothetical protein I7I48_00469 [Histoplasma ohiense (nom. inval.)]